MSARPRQMPDRTGAELRANEILARLPQGPAVAAEVGVFVGDLSELLLRGKPDLKLVMVDNWKAANAGSPYALSGDPHAQLTQEEQDWLYEQTVGIVNFAQDRTSIMRMDSTDAAEEFPPGYFDLVFLDADHSYLSVVADIDAWASRIAPGGYIGGHDYANPVYPDFGVKRAVDEFADGRLETGEDGTWFVRL